MGWFGSSSSSDKNEVSMEIGEVKDPIAGGSTPYAFFRDSEGKEVDRARVNTFNDPITGGSTTYVEYNGERIEIDRK